MAVRRVIRRKYKNDITAEEFRAKYDYNPETGEFWTKPRKVGFVTKTGRGRLSVMIGDSKRGNFYANRLAWLWMMGKWPDDIIDHINGDGTDTRWSNLRQATHSQNMQNQRLSKANTSGLTGAFWDRWAKRWISSIAGTYLGTFPTAEAAHEAYRKAALEKYGEYAHSRLRHSELQHHKGFEEK